MQNIQSLFINCDIGERGINHPVDLKLMDQIGLANIACGGHAGDARSVLFFSSLAERSYSFNYKTGKIALTERSKDYASISDIQKAIRPGLVSFKGAPEFGNQDVGVSPGGPKDRFAVQTGNILLGNSDYSETLEIILPPLIVCKENMLFVITGAPVECFLEKGC